MNLDHGILNIPLTKRGDIDSQMDKYKANKAREEQAARRAASKLLVAQRLEAKRILDAMTPERVAELADKTKSTTSSVRRMLKSVAYFEPAKFIKAEGGAA